MIPVDRIFRIPQYLGIAVQLRTIVRHLFLRVYKYAAPQGRQRGDEQRGIVYYSNLINRIDVLPAGTRVALIIYLYISHNK